MCNDAPVRTVWLLLALSFACDGSDERFVIGLVSTSEGPGPLAPAGFGPEGRVLLARRSPPGRIATVDIDTGATVDAAFDAFPTVHPPQPVSGGLAVVNPVGRLVRYGFDGGELGSAPAEPLGQTAPPVLGADGSIWIASTLGRVVRFEPDGAVGCDVLVDGASVGVAVAAAGRAYISTDTGALIGLEPDGTEVFEQRLAPPLSPPVVTADGVAVLEQGFLRKFGPSGSELASAAVEGAAGLVADRAGGLVAWSTDGRWVRLGEDGAVLGPVEVTAAEVSLAPIALPSGRTGWVDRDGVARSINQDGTIAAERSLDVGTPDGLTSAPSGRGVVVAGDTVLGLDFELAL